MYVHLGGELVVWAPDVVAVLDGRLVSGSEINREFVAKARAAGRLLGDGLTPGCKALVVTPASVLASAISPATLGRRIARRRRAAMAVERET